VKLILQQGKYRALLDQINKRNFDLAHLTMQQTQPTNSKRVAQKAGMANHYTVLRDYAVDLYSVLQKRLLEAPVGGCEVDHNVGLVLQNIPTEDSSDQLSDTVRFKVLFSFSISPSEAISAPWNWREIEFEPFEYQQDTEASVTVRTEEKLDVRKMANESNKKRLTTRVTSLFRKDPTAKPGRTSKTPIGMIAEQADGGKDDMRRALVLEHQTSLPQGLI
jgi:hypothetical protein